MAADLANPPSKNPKPSPPGAEKWSLYPSTGGDSRDFLLHLEAYLARRDGVDKILKISRYAAMIVLASSVLPSSHPVFIRLKSFEPSVGISRKAFRLGKFVQNLNALRSATRDSSLSQADLILYAVAYGGEGIYYFVEQFVWLAKAGLIPSEHSCRLQKISAWAELIGYLGSVSFKVRELKNIQSLLQSKIESSKSVNCNDEIRKSRMKLLQKHLSIIQDLADGLMALGDVRDGKGFLSYPLLMASAGLLSALISAHKNWTSC